MGANEKLAATFHPLPVPVPTTPNPETHDLQEERWDSE